MRIPTGWVGTELEEKYSDALAEGSRQTSRIAVIITAIDKPHLRPDSRFGYVTRNFHFFKHADCPDVIWQHCLVFKHLWENNLTDFGPSPPF